MTIIWPGTDNPAGPGTRRLQPAADEYGGMVMKRSGEVLR